MEVILLIGVFQALFLAGLIQTKKHKSVSDNILSLTLFVYALTIFLAFIEIYNRKNNYPFPAFINTSTPFILLHGPLLWFYIRSLTDQHYRFKPVYLLHFIPFVAVLFVFSLNTYFLSPEEKIRIEISESFKENFSFPLIMAAIAISTQGYYIWGLLMIRGYKKRIKAWFSQTGGIDLQWLRFLITAGIVFYAGISLLYILDYFLALMPYGVLQLSGYSYVSLYILVLGFYGHRQGNVFTSQQINIDLEKTVQEQLEKPLETAQEVFITKLLDHMKTRKPFLDADLTLARLSNAMHVSPEYLSGILNGYLKKNFFDFVNLYRIEEFKTQCREGRNQNLKLISIAYDCGFNSKATFNRVFKNTTGLTPSDYMKGVSEK